MPADPKKAIHDKSLTNAGIAISIVVLLITAYIGIDSKELALIPIVAMTANAFDEDKQKAMESGMNAHVAKPFDIVELMELLNDMLRRSEKGNDAAPSWIRSYV